MIEWFTRNHVAANLLLISIVTAGLFSLNNRIPLEIFPTLETHRININMALRGSTPEDAELGIARRIEEAIFDIEGIEEISSRSTEGGASVIVEVDESYDPRQVLDDIKNQVDAINTFPAEAERPVISLAVRKRDVISVTIAGDMTEREIREAGERVRDELLQIDGITHIDINGVRDYEITIEISQDTLRQFDLSLADVGRAISASSLDLSAGNISSAGGDILIRSQGQAYRKGDFNRIILKTGSDGTLLTLGDIATVNDGFEEKALKTRYNGKNAMTLQVYRVGDQSAIEVADKVKQYIEDAQPSLPTGMALGYWDDDSLIIKSRIHTLVSNAIQGGILVIILLSLFLRPAIAFWVFIGIPVSFLGAFFMMPFLGISLNMISLFAFILVLGIVVDDAIVTGENVYTHLRKTRSSIDAAIQGTQEVAVPVTFGVLTTIAAFVPLALVDGQRGKIFAQITAIVVPVLLFSLIESKFVLPAHLKFIRIYGNEDSSAFNRFQQRFADGFERAVLRYYQPFLQRCLEYRYATLLIFIGVFLLIVTAIMAGHSRFLFFPRIPSETVRMNLAMPTGTAFEVTDRHMQRIDQAAKTLQDKYRDEETGQSVIMNILTSTGGRGGAAHLGNAKFEIAPPEERTIDTDSRALAREWRQMIGTIAGAEEIIFRAEIGRTSDPIDIQLRSNNIFEMQALIESIKTQLANYDTVFDINDSLSQGKEAIDIELLPEAYVLGLTRSDIISQIRQAYFGLEAQRIQRGRDDVRVIVKLPRAERESLAQLRDMQIQVGNRNVPLSNLVTLSSSISPTTIYRIDGYRTVNIRADVEKENTNMTVLQRDLQNYLKDVTTQYPDVRYKMAGETEEQNKSLTSLAWGGFGLLFVIYALLAIPFRSYSQPLIVMSIIPFGMIGAMIGHWIMGLNITIMSVLGLLALIGIIVNDSLVLVDYINKTLQKGGDIMEAISTAGAARFRPVMLTSLTTFIGLVPLLFEKATQAQFLIPMAVSLAFGIVFATLITLILVPINYLLMVRGKQKWQHFWLD